MPENSRDDRPNLRHEPENDLEATVVRYQTTPRATEVGGDSAGTIFTENSAQDHSLTPGSCFGGNFTLKQQLGRGGMGEAWKAYDETADRHVVLKFVPKEIQHIQAAMDSVRGSFKKAHSLQHQHICPLYGLLTDPVHGLFVVMKFVDGVSLDEFRRRSLQRRGRLLFTDAVNILWAAARALDYAHERMIIHRDIKPQNIMISKTDGVQIIDFGLAEEIRMSMVQYSEVAMDIAGTRPYMAPEQWRGRMQDARTDQYALAATAYELFCGAPPFQGSDLGILRECVLKDNPEPIESLPDHVNGTLLRGLSKKRDDRFPDCKSFVKAMAEPRPKTQGVGLPEEQEHLVAEGSAITQIPLETDAGGSHAPAWLPKSVLETDSHVSTKSSHGGTTQPTAPTFPYPDAPHRHVGQATVPANSSPPIPVIVTGPSSSKKQEDRQIIRASREERTILYTLIVILIILLLVLGFYLIRVTTPQPPPPKPRPKTRAGLMESTHRHATVRQPYGGDRRGRRFCGEPLLFYGNAQKAMKKSYFPFIIGATLLLQQFSIVGDLRASEPTDVSKAVRKAVEFYRNQVSTEGGYLWRYSSDLSMRQGENKADDQTVWVQPPGTPSIGQVFLKAWQVTGDPYYLEAATETGLCLVRGQLQSGGWTYQIHFEPNARKNYAYRTDFGKANGKGRNISTLDDDTTQSATAFLAELDAALDFKNEKIHEAAQYALNRLLEVQFPNGGYAQRFDGGKKNDADPQRFPVKRAEFPPEGTEPTHEKDYSQFYTLNDNLVRDLLRTFFVAAEVYGIEKDGVLISNEKYVAAARRLGDFLLLAQMPEPQPAWAQQYDFQMRPCWARKFEPAAVTGGESQGAIDALLELYLFTGDKKYLEPIPRAVAYLERSKLPDGKLARFYEMRTNRPLYMTKNYELTYDGDDVPTHYAFTIGLRSWPVDEYRNMDEPTRLRRLESLRNSYRNRSIRKANAKEIPSVFKTMDDRGAWVTRGTLLAQPGASDLPIIDNGVFIKHMNLLLNAFVAEKDVKKGRP